MVRTSYGLKGIDLQFGDSKCKFKKIENKDIIEYCRNRTFVIPNIQRDIEEDKVLGIKNKFIEKWKKNENYFIHHGFTISLCAIKNNFKEFYVIDGQHRLEAISQLEEYKFTVFVRIMLCDSLNEMINDFKYININSNIALNYQFFEGKFLNSTILEVRDTLKRYFKNGFNRNNNPKSKVMHINEFLKILDINKVKELYNNRGIEFSDNKYLLNSLLEINEEIKNKFDLEFKENKRYYIDLRTFNKVYGKNGKPGTNFFLSLRNINWQDKLFKNKKIEYKSIAYKKKKIPKSVRTKLFDLTFGVETNMSTCYVCSSRITRATFEAGHIIAEHLGGSNNISNLKCICSGCNKSMGTRNLEEFKTEYFGPMEY